ncbi:NAD-glutamate dehydrogenase [Sphingorhabdus sp.]|uniref:NAD-glutamate dehydrogenase n=1 Tax=Sphingorhabdus sp. TaxID=1902408 RepID=UPI0035935A01
MAAAKMSKPSSNVENSLLKAMATAFADSALPGENEGFDTKACEEAARFTLQLAHDRKAGSAGVALDSFTDPQGRMAMRIAMNNDDMPFLVDSISAAVAAKGIGVRRLIHPVLSTTRDESGLLKSVNRKRDASITRESFIYLETDRVDAKERRALEDDLLAVLRDVRGAVTDWRKMLGAMSEDADSLPDGEGAALVRWFLENNMTILGHENLSRDGKSTKRLGLSRVSNAPLLSELSVGLAIKWFEEGGRAPLILKANRVSSVHRHVQLDLVVVPVRDGSAITGLSVSAGLWTSAALATAPDRIPVLRTHLATLMERFGFDSSGHAGKAMTHVLTSLPHDLLVSLKLAELERVTLTAMSLTDRPRPKLLAIRSPLGRHLYIFVWLPRDDVSTGMRKQIEDMLVAATGGAMLGWTISLEDGGIALLRYTLDLPDRNQKVDEGQLDDKLELMVRGWEPAVEAALARLTDEKRAAAMLVRYGALFPGNYRTRYSSEEAARDMLGLLQMERDHSKITRLSSDGEMLRLKVFSEGGAMPLSDMVPALENFGFDVLEESPTALNDGNYIHDFKLGLRGSDAASVMERAPILESALSQVLDGDAENDVFNQLVTVAALQPQSVILLRAWYRYLRQTGVSYGMPTAVAALAKHAGVTRAIISLFDAMHDPAATGDRDKESAKYIKVIDAGLAAVSAIDEDRILRRYLGVVRATLRTNAFAPAAADALAFKLDSAKVPGLPAPLPWREVFVYSPRVEGIHLRAGPVARGGLRWSDRRDDFRTEVLGLMKAQRVKNAVIVPTGAKGGFYPKRLPDMRVDRDAWFAEGTESYRLFIRTLLSITDNIINDKVVHPESVVIHDGEDPYFVVAADKGTATFSDTANAIALEHNFWLGDAFASGGSVGYDHKAMGITAKGGWLSVQRHLAEMGINVQKEPVTVAGVGDMSGDVFGNGMLLSKTLKVVAAFDHRHIFFDPSPDPAISWKERQRLFNLPRSSWLDYDSKLISKGGGVFARSEKSIKTTPEIRALLGIDAKEVEPSELMIAILKAPVQLLWFGGIGTYIKDKSESHLDVGDPGNDAIRVNGTDVRAQVIGEGANLGVTQAGRIGFALRGGRINTDFIDNSAGVDCSDNEVNIKIALNAEMRAGKLKEPVRNKLLVEMTDAVAHLVLEDNRLQTLALSIAETGGAGDLPAYVRLIETFESNGRLDRVVEGIAPNEELFRRASEGRGLTRPELAVLLSTAKLAVQDGVEHAPLAKDESMEGELLAAFPQAMVKKHKSAILAHRLRKEIIATKLANRMINRLGLLHPFELAEEEGCGLGEVAAAFAIAERIYDLPSLWQAIDTAEMPEATRLLLFNQTSVEVRAQMADIIRNATEGRDVGATTAVYGPVVQKLSESLNNLLPADVRHQTESFGLRLVDSGAPRKIADRLVKMAQLDGAIGLAALSATQKADVTALTQAFTAIGDALGIGWAQGTAMQMDPHDPWERLLVAGLARDFQAMRLDFLRRRGAKKSLADAQAWLSENDGRVRSFKAMVDRARMAGMPTPAMLAQIAGQARVLLGR